MHALFDFKEISMFYHILRQNFCPPPPFAQPVGCDPGAALGAPKCGRDRCARDYCHTWACTVYGLVQRLGHMVRYIHITYISKKPCLWFSSDI